MKKQEGYAYSIDEANTRYAFVSTGPKGDIVKVVLFEEIAQGFWNLSFGDLTIDGDFDDSIVTDNNDMRMVLQSIANIIHEFFDHHPDSEVYFEPVDKRRKLLYNRIFQERHEEILPVFNVSGVFKQPLRRVKYLHQTSYDCFIVKRK
jgi:hypothetical protein